MIKLAKWKNLDDSGEAVAVRFIFIETNSFVTGCWPQTIFS
jgi:hypothetical protein